MDKEFHRIPYKRLRVKDGRLPKWFSKLLPVKTSSVSRLIGRCPFDVPNIKGKIHKGSKNFMKFLTRRSDVQYNCKYSHVFPGSWEFNCDNLNIMATENLNKFSYSDLLNGISR